MSSRIVTVLLFSAICVSCGNKSKEEAMHIVSEWRGKVLTHIPTDGYIAYSRDTSATCSMKIEKYAIVSYVGEDEANSCSLQLYEWRAFIQELESLLSVRLPCLLIVHPKNRNAFVHTLREFAFDYPVFIDGEDNFNKANHFPPQSHARTFFVDKKGKVLFIGNPISDARIREAYLNLASEKKDEDRNERNNGSLTDAALSSNRINMGRFRIGEVKTSVFEMSNEGKSPLCIYGVKVNCGCIRTEYDKSPVGQHGRREIRVEYHAITPGIFRKNLMVYCNSKHSPLKVTVEGNVEKTTERR